MPQLISRIPVHQGLGSKLKCLRGASFLPPGGIGTEDERDLVADAAEFAPDLLFGSGCVGGIVEAQDYSVGKDGALQAFLRLQNSHTAPPSIVNIAVDGSGMLATRNPAVKLSSVGDQTSRTEDMR